MRLLKEAGKESVKLAVSLGLSLIEGLMEEGAGIELTASAQNLVTLSAVRKALCLMPSTQANTTNLATTARNQSLYEQGFSTVPK